MAQNLISASLTAADAAEVQQNLTAAKSKLKFLLSLRSGDVVTLVKVGNAFIPFIEKAYQVVLTHPEILPPVFDKEEFMRDYELLITLRPLFNQIKELAESIQNTFMAVGSDTMLASLDVYSSVKQNKDKVPGLSVMADEMAVFFKKAKAKSTSNPN